MTLRLDPRHPLLWRSSTSIQFGGDEPIVVIDDLGPAHERMLTALGGGISASGVRMLGRDEGLDDPAIEAFLRAIRPALRPRAARRPTTGRPRSGAGSRRRTAWRVAVDGTGRTASTIARLLLDAGIDLAHPAEDPLLPGAPRLDAVVVVAGFTVTPSRGGRWLRADVPHLAVVFGDSSATIGPFVDPGRGPCLFCVELSRADADPAWPLLASQLHTVSPASETSLLSGYIAAVATRLVLDAVAGNRSRGPIDDDLRETARRYPDASGAFTERPVAAHPRCGCRSPAGNVMALGDRSAPAATPTTTAGDVAVPA